MKISVLSNAKINLTLDITGVTDNGYHLIDSVFQSVSLSDRLNLTLNDSGKITVIANQNEICGESNIAYKAAKAYLQALDSELGVDIEIQKNISIAAGLGGGSSNAAVTLLALNKLFCNKLSSSKLSEIALGLGADVPFCLSGGTMRAQGIGEILTPLKNIPQCFFVLMKNAKKGSTGQMYAKLDAIKDLSHPDTAAMLNAIDSADYSGICKNVGNVFSQVWDYSHLKSLAIKTGCDAVSLSGSGPTVFAMYSDYERALFAKEFTEKQGIEAYICTPTQKSFIFE